MLCLVILRVFLKYFSGVGWLQKIKLKSVESNGKMRTWFPRWKLWQIKRWPSMLLLYTKFSVPRKTLDDCIKGRVQHGSTPGVDTVLTAEEEAGLESYLLHMAGCGFSLTRTMVKAHAWAIAKCSGQSNWFHPEYGPGNHWCLFKQHHPSLALHKSENLERSRVEALHPAIVPSKNIIEDTYKFRSD